MFDRIKALMARWHDLQEVDAMSDRDLDDLGMTRHQVTLFVQMPKDVPDRVAAMAEIFGLSDAEVKANHARYVEILEVCGTCGYRGACQLVLDRGELSRPIEASFCPNARDYTDMAQA